MAAEADGPLTERLGQPEAYAAELWASAAALAATHNDNELLEPEQLVDRDANPVGNRYPQRQQQLDQGTGERSPAPPAPEFRPPPGPVRTP